MNVGYCRFGAFDGYKIKSVASAAVLESKSRYDYRHVSGVYIWISNHWRYDEELTSSYRKGIFRGTPLVVDLGENYI